MRKGQEPPAVRVLPADGSTPFESEAPMQPGPGPRRSWPIPLAVAAAAAALFFVATFPSSDDAESETAAAASNSIDADVIDLTDTDSTSMTTGWEEIPLETPGQIEGIITRNATSFIAYGSTDAGAATWASGNGATWRPMSAVDIPADAPSRIDHAVTWDNDVIAMGTVGDETGLWVASTASRWEYQGEIADMAGHALVGVAAGPELLAVAEQPARNGEKLAWTSIDGLEWTSVGPLQGADRLAVTLTLAADHNGYYLGGEAACEEGRCEPVIYRSANGVDWEVADLELPDPSDQQAGTVLDIASSSRGLVAVGVLGPFPAVQVAVWRSADGHEWVRLGEDEPSFQQPSVGVALLSVIPGETPIAEVSVSGERHQVAAGSELATDVGSFTITEVAEDHLRLTHDSNVRRLGIGGTLNLTRTAQPWQVAVQGPRIAIAGAQIGPDTRTPMFWASDDGGHTWERTVAPDDGIAVGVAINGNNIAAATWTGSDKASFWRSEWDTSAAESLAVETLSAYITAINDRDVEALAALLPADLRGSPRPSFQIPSIGDRTHQWWDQDKGTLQLDLVQQTIDYLDAMNTTIDIEECRPFSRLGVADTLRVDCEFESTSDLADTLGTSTEQGQLDGQFADGALRVVNVSSPTSATMWDRIASAADAVTEADRATVLQLDPAGQARVAPTFTRDTAAAHLRIARVFVEGLLRPGEAKVVETVLGTMEWQWLDEMPAPVFSFSWIAPVDDGFIATAITDDAGPSNVSLWSSQDGLTWTEVAAPQNVDWMWNIMPFRDGLVAEGWGPGPLSEGWGIDAPVIVIFDGTQWSTLSIPRDDTGGNAGLSRMAVNGGELLVLTESWTDDGPPAHAAWVLGGDDVFRNVELPEDLRDLYEIIGLVARDGEYVLGAAQNGRGLTLWRSRNGDEWSRLGDSVSPEGAEFVWNLEQHHDEYFAMGETEAACEPNEFPCETMVGVWHSPGGTTWDRLLTGGGEQVSAYEISSGRLGLVAVGQERFSDQTGPRAVFLSPDAQNWDRVGNLNLLDPDAQWWWISRPAVGEEAIVMAGMANTDPEDDFSGLDEPFLIVGRVID